MSHLHFITGRTPSPGDLEKYANSSHARYMDECLETGEGPIIQMRNHLILAILIHKAQRAGPIINMTIQDYDRAVGEGDHVVVKVSFSL